MQTVKKAVSCSEKRRKLHANWLTNSEDTPTSTNTVRRRAALAPVAWQTNKITKKLLFFSFSCRRTFIDLHQTLHADRGRQYNFYHRQLFLDPIPSFCSRGQKQISRFFRAKNFFVINPSFMNRILPKLKYRCRPSSSINIVSFIIFDQGICRYGAKIKIFYGIF